MHLSGYVLKKKKKKKKMMKMKEGTEGKRCAFESRPLNMNKVFVPWTKSSTF